MRPSEIGVAFALLVLGSYLAACPRYTGSLLPGALPGKPNYCTFYGRVAAECKCEYKVELGSKERRWCAVRFSTTVYSAVYDHVIHLPCDGTAEVCGETLTCLCDPQDEPGFDLILRPLGAGDAASDAGAP